MTLYKQSSSIIPNTLRQQMVAEFRQNIQYGLLNGKEVKDLSYSLLLIGIESDIRDYIIMVKYPSLPGTDDDARLTQELQVTQSLISSFRPVKVLNPEKQLQELRDKANRYSKELFTKGGETAFLAEFRILLYRLSGVDLDNPDNRLRAMNQLKPFKILSDLANLQNKQILSLWDALQEAEKGNASEFKRILTELIELNRDGALSQDEDGSLISPKDEQNSANT